jgi:lipoprotein-anchoring transpeptidase ErfK/SrfK
MRVLAILLALALPLSAQQGSAPVVSETVAVQVMLDRARFSPGEIDGRQGINLKRALMAFQSAEHLQATGKLDQATWQRLTERSGNQPALIGYSVTDADIAGPFTPMIPSDLLEQSKLDALGYQSPLEALSERFHVSPALLKTLNPGATFFKAGESLTVTNVQAPAAPVISGTVTLNVTRSTSALTLEDDSGHVILHAPVTSGSQHDPLPIGTWKVTGVQQNPAFHYNPALFWDADPSHSKAKLQPGPNNPVGTVWIDISKEHYGIHGTPSPSTIGHVESHGCVRLTNWDAQRVAALVKPGTKVVFR